MAIAKPTAKPTAQPVSNGHDPTSDDLRWTLLFGIGLLALLFVRLVALHFNVTELFFDEAQYWAWSEEPAFGYYSKPPFIAWIVRAATGLCGPGEACVRLPSPFIHAATSIVIFLIGRRLYDARVGALSGLAFATLPGVSLSAGLISTDVPLLFFWALGILAFVLMQRTQSLWPVLLLGLSFGLGLNAKYAMAYFILCLGVYVAITPSARSILSDRRLYLAFALGVALIVPNLVWNYQHSFATFSHTAANADWRGSLMHPVQTLEFLGSQFGVFGPVLFGAFIVIIWRAFSSGLPEPDRLLLCFSLPILAVITVQAFLSRAHANWAAATYVGASILVIATMLRDDAWGWLKGSFAVNIALLVLIVAGTSLAGHVPLPVSPDPFARLLGWRDVAAATRAELNSARNAGHPFVAVLTDEREVTSELLYYMRGEPTPILAWREGKPHNHFELMRPYTATVGGPVLLVSLSGADSRPALAFSDVRKIDERDLPAGEHARRRVTFYALSGYKGQ
jgi:4-amino-4-deoxy-L-arabinose transferase-like glycosyltransferase